MEIEELENKVNEMLGKIEQGKKILLKLGYKLMSEDKRQIRFDQKFEYNKGQGFDTWIAICPLDEIVYVGRYDMVDVQYLDVRLTIEELNAINLICEGLGWTKSNKIKNAGEIINEKEKIIEIIRNRADKIGEELEEERKQCDKANVRRNRQSYEISRRNDIIRRINRRNRNKNMGKR